MKRFICLVILCLVLVFSVSAENNGIKVFLDGTEISFDTEPQIIDGRTMVPIRAIFEAMGAVVYWDSTTNTAFCSKDDTVVTMTVGNPDMYINSQIVAMDSVPIIINSRVLAPARYAAESFGATVYWDGEKNSVFISTVPANEVVTLYAADGRTINVYGNQIQDYLNVGWYRTKEETIATMYTPDGRKINVYKAEVHAYKTAGWYESAFAARCMNIPKGKAVPTSAEGCVYITPTGKKYHIDPDCGGKNSYPAYFDDALRTRLQPCSKCVS